MISNKLNSNHTKPDLCDITLGYIINNCKERLKILENRKQTPSTLGRITEMQSMIVYLQQMMIDNIN